MEILLQESIPTEPSQLLPTTLSSGDHEYINITAPPIVPGEAVQIHQQKSSESEINPQKPWRYSVFGG